GAGAIAGAHAAETSPDRRLAPVTELSSQQLEVLARLQAPLDALDAILELLLVFVARAGIDVDPDLGGDGALRGPGVLLRRERRVDGVLVLDGPVFHLSVAQGRDVASEPGRGRRHRAHGGAGAGSGIGGEGFL